MTSSLLFNPSPQHTSIMRISRPEARAERIVSLRKWGIYILHDAHGAPHLETGQHISIAHTKEIQMIFIHPEPCGIDLERDDRVLSKTLCHALKAHSRHEALARWTELEAYSKLTQTPLRACLRSPPDVSDLHCRHFSYPNHIGSLLTASPIKALMVIDTLEERHELIWTPPLPEEALTLMMLPKT